MVHNQAKCASLNPEHSESEPKPDVNKLTEYKSHEIGKTTYNIGSTFSDSGDSLRNVLLCVMGEKMNISR